MKRDKARIWTDKHLDKMERKLKKIYRKSAKGIYKSFEQFMLDAQKELKRYEYIFTAQLNKDIDTTGIEKQIQRKKEEIILRNQAYKDMIDGVTTELAETNTTALAYINGQMPSIYRNNYNQMQAEASRAGVKFNIVSEDLVKRRILDGDIKLPKKRINIPKDKRWNTKQLNSSVLQGILQGESMEKIAKRILPIVNNNANASIRNARTMVTGAENQGRSDSYKRLESDGAIIVKEWVATDDDRTRIAHRELDGQSIRPDEKFVDMDGNELEYPGDPSGAPETVYNCRCTMVGHVAGYKGANGYKWNPL